MATGIKTEINDGISQSERYIPALDIAYFGIDEKETSDLLKLLCDISSQFNYYHYSNTIQGDWKEFLTSDIDILAALLSRIDSRGMANEYKKLSDALLASENEAQLIQSLKAIFEFIRNFISLQIEYHNQFEIAINLGHTNQSEPYIEVFTQHLQKLYAYNCNAVKLFGNDVQIAFDSKYLNSTIETSSEPFHKFGTPREKVLLSIPYFDDLVTDLDAKYTTLLNTSRQYLKEQFADGAVYDPHIVLLIAFLHLYSYLQKPVNRLLEKHLDYFYRDIIGMHNRKESLDQLHLIVEPVPGSSPIYLNEGEEVIAEIEGHQEKLIYAIDNTVQVTGTQIKELKTVFISNRIQLRGQKSRAGDVNELQVYKGNYPAPLPNAFQKKETVLPWPLLGEDQSSLSIEQKTMEEAEIGLAVASPLFYQADGHRNFILKFFIRQQSFLQFEEHAQKMSYSSHINKEILMLKMLNQAFTIFVTGSTGWIPIQSHAVSYADSSTGSECWISVKFKMDNKTESTAVYNDAIHGFGLGLKWPVVRLMLNNASFHHPYTFLSYFIIDRIAVKVDVQESKSFDLRNNLGNLYAVAPFQPFGPTPVNGSYLDIRNANIFNRYTSYFCLQLYWFDLPANEDGFFGYYKGYDAPFAKGSFKVALSSGESKSGSETQQEFLLFEYKTNNGKDFLKGTTTMDGADLRLIHFDNAPNLDAKESEGDFNQGTLRMELTGPSESFGHRLYTQAFIEAAEHNTKRFVKNRPLPNQPYTPVIKSLSIDYMLEHSELTRGISHTEEEEIIMVHLYPFGYDPIYSGKNSKDNFFVPPPRHESNLFLGLSDLAANQELSLLFQLSEENFHHSVREPELINWSHLVKNNWVSLPASGVLLDTTNNFVNTGVVTLRIPDGIEKNNTILNPNLYWIRASLPSKSSLRSKTIAIFAQAAIAVRKPGQAGFPDSTYISPPDTVKGLYGNFPAIQALRQLFPSFGGYPKESDRQYNTRVSERLRHKQRLLSILDISQAILDAFPQILMVKCYNTDDNNHMILPGVDINLIVIPKEHEDGSFISQEPKVSLAVLYAIKKFLSHSVSDFIRVEVGNPVYERIMVVAKVKFKAIDEKMQSDGYYLKRINQEIKKCISAWLYDARCDLKMDSEIYVLEILSHLQELPYVDYITGFSLIHFFKVWDRQEESFQARVTDTSIDNKETLKGSVPGAILISAEEHQLTVIKDALPEPPVKSGIGDFLIGSDLLISHSVSKRTKKEATALPEEFFDFTVYHK